MESRVCRVCLKSKFVNDFEQRRLLCKSCRNKQINLRKQNNKLKENEEDFDEIVAQMEMYSDPEIFIEDPANQEIDYQKLNMRDIVHELYKRSANKNLSVDDDNSVLSGEIIDELDKEVSIQTNVNDTSIYQEYVYIIKSPQQLPDWYKIGRHTGTKKSLRNRYHTALGEIEIIRLIPINESTKHEKTLHNLLSEYRSPNTEWFVVPKTHLLLVFDDYFDQLGLKDRSILNRRLWTLCKKTLIDKANIEETEYELLNYLRMYLKLST
jgi:hypothetical protein